MGNTYTGISNDIEALWFNTAGICEIDYPVVSALFSKDISGTNHGFLAFALPLEKFTAAVSVSALQTEKIEITPQTQAAYTIRPESDYIAMFALGIPIGGFLDVGGGVKFLHSELAEEYTAQTVVFDEGLLLRGIKHPEIGEISVGVSYQNLGKKIKYDEKYNELPQILRGGVSVKKTKKDTGEIVIGYDISKITGADIHHNFGIELTAFDKWLTKPLTSFSIRAGYEMGYSIEGPSFGLGFGLKKIRFDYGLQLTDFETRHKFLISYSFEPDTPEEEEEFGSVEKSTGAKIAETSQIVKKPIMEKTTIAVMNFSAGGVSAFEAGKTADLLRAAIVNTDTFIVVERSQLEHITGELGLPQGCTDQIYAMQIGKALNAKKVITGSVSKPGTAYIVDIRLVNVETGKIEYTDKSEMLSIGEIENAVKELAQRIVRQVKTK